MVHCSIADQAKPATHDGVIGRILDEPVRLVLRPAGFGGYPALELLALPHSSARVLKAQVRARCRGLAAVPDERLRLLYRGVELPDDGPLARHVSSVGNTDSVELHLLAIDGRAAVPSVGGGVAEGGNDADADADLYVSKDVPCTAELEALVTACREGLRAGAEPLLALSGSGGTYFLRDATCERMLAVFKPKDEEAGTPQNPRGYGGHENSRGPKPGVPSAHRAAREVAAYLLDHGGFAGVPATTLAHGRHRCFVPLRGGTEVIWKVGAFQACVDTSETSDNFGAQMYPMADVHRIGILDTRIANFDRNHGNMLVKVAQADDGARGLRLVPIDHGCALPDRLGIWVGDVVWMDWPQARQPFGEEELRYIKGLDGHADAWLLSERLGLERDGLRLLEVTTRWLQAAAAQGLTLREVGAALYRSEAGMPSAVESVVAECVDSAMAGAAPSPPGDPRHLSAPEGLELERGVSATATAEPPRGGVSEVRGGAAGDCRDGIFWRDDGQGRGAEWTPQLEETFLRHVRAKLERLARARAAAMVAALPTPELQPVGPAPPPERLCSEVDVPKLPHAGAPGAGVAMDEYPPDELPRRSSRAYVPPHLRTSR